MIYQLNHAVTEMPETAMALESSTKRLPADDTALHRAAEGENFAGDQTLTDAAAPPVTGGIPRTTMQKHSLEHSWTFWFDNPSGKSKRAAWGSSIRPVHTFSTVEDFWGLFNNIHRPSRLAVGADLHCFKHGIEPKWEDPVCANGGKWTICCSRGKVDLWWLYTLLALLGEQFDHGNDVCGAVINVRAKQKKISIWTKNAFNEAAQVSIGRQWKEFLVFNDTIAFILHDDAKRQDRHAKSRYQA